MNFLIYQADDTVPTSEFFLPPHFCKHVLNLLEEVRHFAALFIPLRIVVDTRFRLLRQILTNVWDGENNTLHGSVLSHNLTKTFIVHAICSKPKQIKLHEVCIIFHWKYR